MQAIFLTHYLPLFLGFSAIGLGLFLCVMAAGDEKKSKEAKQS